MYTMQYLSFLICKFSNSVKLNDVEIRNRKSVLFRLIHCKYNSHWSVHHLVIDPFISIQINIKWQKTTSKKLFQRKLEYVIIAAKKETIMRLAPIEPNSDVNLFHCSCGFKLMLMLALFKCTICTGCLGYRVWNLR